MPSSIFKAGVLALACASTASATTHYTLKDDYEGVNFFDKFNFLTDNDPTAGFVDYKSQSVAQSSGLIEYRGTQAYMGVDYKNPIPLDGSARGRPSVRIESKQFYNHGLFIADLAHMPASVCGTWPAFWTVSKVNYPAQGEIDILENIHENTVSLHALHTAPMCEVVGNVKGKQQSANQNTYNCDDTATTSDYGSKTQYKNQGCAATSTDPNSFGSTFNAQGGGVYAMEWTSDYIKVWNFEPSNVPTNLRSANPNPDLWGTPAFTTLQGSCDIDTHFKDHQVIFDTTFCGNWAGQDDLWKATSCYDKVKYPSCYEYVAANPGAYKNAYWLVNSLKVYTKTTVTSTSTTMTSTTTSHTSTSTTTTHSTTTTTSSTTSTTSSSTSTTSSSTTTSAAPTTSAPTAEISTSSTASETPSTSASETTTSTNVPPVSPEGPTSAAPSGKPTSSAYPTTAPYGNHSITSTGPMTTSTVYTTSLYTITRCPPTVTNCPVGHVVTKTIPLYTTVCPVSGEHPAPTSKGSLPPPPPPPKSTTSTLYITSVYTITSCAPTVTNCPVGVVTSEVFTTTTVCPYSAPSHTPVSVIPSSVINSHPVETNTAKPVTRASSESPVIITSTATVQPIVSTPVVSSYTPHFTTIKGSNSTAPIGTGTAPVQPTKAPVLTTSAGGAVTPTESPIYAAGAAGIRSDMKAGSVLALVLAGVVAMFL